MTAPTPLPLHVCLAIAPELAVADAALALESIPKAMITNRKRKRKWKGKQRFDGCEFLLPPTVGIRSAVASCTVVLVGWWRWSDVLRMSKAASKARNGNKRRNEGVQKDRS